MYNKYNRYRKDIVKSLCTLLVPFVIGCNSGIKEVSADLNNDGLDERIYVEEIGNDTRVVIDYQGLDENEDEGVLITSSYDQGISGLEVKTYNKDERPDICVFVHQKGLKMLKTKRMFYNRGNDKEGIAIFREEEK